MKMNDKEKIESLNQKMNLLTEECNLLRVENQELKSRLGLRPLNTIQPKSSLKESRESKTHQSNKKYSTQEKIDIFKNLFKGRNDVYASRWDNQKTNRSGYSPVCGNEWVQGVCDKPRIKCSDCNHRDFLSITDQTIHNHLTGKKTIGLYPLCVDETCYFLAADFDKEDWQDDTSTFLETCKENDIPAYLERSRSGKGGHVWIFFEDATSAATARRLGCLLLTKSMNKRHQLGFDSYDRFFPNQDTMPKGGFGNLIALPLQKGPREKGNSVFVDENFTPYKDQWGILSKVEKVGSDKVFQMIHSVSVEEDVMDVQRVVLDEEEKPKHEKPWLLPDKSNKKDKLIPGPFPDQVNVILANMVYIEKAGLPPAMLNHILRIAAFQNPEFYKAQAMRLSTYGKPRIISCGDDFPQHVAVPRGCLPDIEKLLGDHEIKLNITDERNEGNKIEVSFNGTLRELQSEASEAILKYDMGILCASTAFGKTVVAANIIAKRKVNTLILVHRKQLMDQWKARLSVFLEVPKNSIGEIGGGKSKPTGMIDIATIQSLHRKGETNEIVTQYGQMIIDECHHVSAFSFEQVLKKVKAKYTLGLTATPIRKDGHHPIITMQCGPIRFHVSPKQHQKMTNFEYQVIPKQTHFDLNSSHEKLSVQEIYGLLVSDDNRNQMIFDDILKCLEAGKSPLILTQRKEHLEILHQKLKGFAKNIIILKGGMGKKQRQKISETMDRISDKEERVILATGKYIGEGFDDSRLDTLFLVMPISWKGTLQQYVGRLHRNHDDKKVVQVYDYVDSNVIMLQRMYERRLKGYGALGYCVATGKV